MNSMEGRSRQSSPFDDLPSFGFFYSNLANREVLAALRYGIEARKGLLLFTGEAGTGKSAILHELARASNAQFVLIHISDPRLRLKDLLALILETLDVEVQGEDEPARIRSCQAALRSGLEADRIVALALDDAQDLADDIVESLTRHFLGQGFAPENNLLQIILAGRPELRERLMRPPLRSLPTQVEIACRLTPLAAKDVGRYIRHRLAAADRSATMFDDEAIALIAEYSEGRPGMVNAICRHALEWAHSSSGGEIPLDTVVRAARELEIEKTGGEAVTAGAARQAGMYDEARGPYPVIVASAGFSDFAASKTVRRSSSLVRANGRRVSAWLVLTFVTALAAWLDGVPVLSYGRNLSERLGEIAGLNPQIPEAGSSSSNLPLAQDDSRAIATEQPSSNASIATQPGAPGDHSAKTLESSEKPPAESRASTSAPPARSSRDQARQSEPTEKQHKRDLAKAVSRAIENRAILGVNVSASGSMVYLDGRVPTPAQKDAAERAARSVPDVGGVRNRIAVE